MADDLDALEEAARAVGGWAWTRAPLDTYVSALEIDARGTTRAPVADFYFEEDAAYAVALHPGAALALIARVRRAEAALRTCVALDDPYLHDNESAWRAAMNAARAALEARTDGE
jgi:hypothetical protein